jgi:hypothetical protein
LTPQKNASAKGKCSYRNLGWPFKNQTSGKKKYFTINFIHLIHTACQTLSTFTNQCHCLRLHSQCFLLKTSHDHFWLDAMLCCYYPHWLNNTLYLLVYEVTWTHEDSKFSPHIVLMMLRIWFMWPGFLCLLISLSSWFFYGF